MLTWNYIYCTNQESVILLRMIVWDYIHCTIRKSYIFSSFLICTVMHITWCYMLYMSQKNLTFIWEVTPKGLRKRERKRRSGKQLQKGRSHGNLLNVECNEGKFNVSKTNESRSRNANLNKWLLPLEANTGQLLVGGHWWDNYNKKLVWASINRPLGPERHVSYKLKLFWLMYNI